MSEIIALINKMSPYLLLGFLLAGLMHAFVPSRLYRRYLGGSSFGSVINAALLGVPLPLCSCGVIPTAMSLRREGASKGAAVSFLIATPQTGVDSICATYSLMGLHFALLRPVAALATALLGGQVVNMFDEKDATVVEQAEMQTEQTLTFGGKILKALKYAFVDMMQDIGRWLVVGLVVAGLITVFVPASFFALFADNSLLSMVIVLLFAMPMYLCATGSIPIAVALMLKGLSPGTALVLLMAGPAVNAASMLVVGKVLGRRSLMLYLLSIVGGAMAFGLAVDYLLPREWFTESIDAMAAGAGRGQGWFNIVCSVVMVALLVNALVRRFRKSPEAECGCEACGEEQPSEQTFYVEGM
ncbi:MAG: permease, partial [Alistipes sp.]|nr:permease [Alistipes sp.]